MQMKVLKLYKKKDVVKCPLDLGVFTFIMSLIPV